MTSFFDAFKSKAALLQLPLGFSSGLPNPLVTGTLTAWMATEGVDLTTIGLFGLASLPYNFKFLWAPLLDRFSPPLLSRRRSWMVVFQVLLCLGVFALGSIDPTEAGATLAGMVVLVTFLSASQDIVADAYRTDVLLEHERASGAALFVAGYRFALLASGGLALILSDHMSWREVYWLMAGAMSIGVVATMLAPAPEVESKPPRGVWESIVRPLSEFFRRDGAWVMFGIVVTYKVGDAVAGHLLTPFLMEVGFSRTDIGGVQKVFGLIATIVGSLAGGGFVSRYGLRRCLIAFGVLQAIANGLYALLAVVGQSYPLLVLSIGVDNFFNGLGTAAFVALLMTLCHRKHTATQYALLSSAMSIVGRLLGASGGAIVEGVGWPIFFGITILAAAPAIVLLALRPIAEPDEETLAAAAEEAANG